jgi:octaprenyl-diphosphate synthase
MTSLIHLAYANQPLADLLEERLERVTVVFERQLASELSAVNGLCLHVEEYRGKMLRPTLVLLSGLAAEGEPCDGTCLNEQHETVAAVVEMIHMATLVHDDVLDEAEVRRGGTTVNRLWGNETAVMLGDYLISNAFHLCSTARDPQINLALGQVTNTLCEGELLQLSHREDWSIDEHTYFEIIQRKTASLIGACCQLGAMLANATPEVVNALESFGISLGTAFQIRDDLLDLVGDEDVVGKTLGKDLDNGKLTLPLIDYLVSASPTARGTALRCIEQRDAATLQRLIVDSGVVRKTSERAAACIEQAKAQLQHIPASPARELLETLADNVISRSR